MNPWDLTEHECQEIINECSPFDEGFADRVFEKAKSICKTSPEVLNALLDILDSLPKSAPDAVKESLETLTDAYGSAIDYDEGFEYFFYNLNAQTQV